MGKAAKYETDCLPPLLPKSWMYEAVLMWCLHKLSEIVIIIIIIIIIILNVFLPFRY
jgi:hypothetical protein